ncbi:hypothetical protein [Paenibacillus xerothermodurans]|uniref:Uncharacterized protein n=1 Tax=Paenibacillus xerothermodurans TaxID=1977292 RepID=A0A2W1NMZ1_PAEXE|nr:hypothetical protein [Paenibacillus xerothermodurans]PZE19176.1 hypothetical protein CBW46_019605 [Paenibacillus xerothermodurans]
MIFKKTGGRVPAQAERHYKPGQHDPEVHKHQVRKHVRREPRLEAGAQDNGDPQQMYIQRQ